MPFEIQKNKTKQESPRPNLKSAEESVASSLVTKIHSPLDLVLFGLTKLEIASRYVSRMRTAIRERVGFEKVRNSPKSDPIGSRDNYTPWRPESATHVPVKPVDRALPGQIGRGFVIPFWCRVAIEAMSGARIDVAFVRNVRRA